MKTVVQTCFKIFCYTIFQGVFEIAEAWFDQGVGYWKQAIALLIEFCENYTFYPPVF